MVFEMEMQYIFCEVGAEFLNITEVTFSRHRARSVHMSADKHQHFPQQ
jgi:hypothetical protein